MFLFMNEVGLWIWTLICLSILLSILKYTIMPQMGFPTIYSLTKVKVFALGANHVTSHGITKLSNSAKVLLFFSSSSTLPFISNYDLSFFVYTINNEIIFKNSMAGLKLTVFIHIKIYKMKTILALGLHFPSSVV